MNVRRGLGLALVILLLVLVPKVYGVPTNLLFNPGFETPALGVTPGTPVTYGSLCLGGTSAADNWPVWVNDCPSSMSTVLLPSTLPGGGNYMLEVTTSGDVSGIYQPFLPYNTGPVVAIGSAWLYLNSGCVGVGVGNDGNTGVTVSTCVTGQWIKLTTLNGVSPANEFIVYTTTAGGADFYVDNAYASAVPEPASLTLLVLGAAEIVRRRLRKAE